MSKLCSRGDERLKTYNVPHRNRVRTIGNICRRISHPCSNQEHLPCQERELRMLHIEMLAVGFMHAERNKWRGLEESSNFFRIHRLTKLTD